MVKNSKKPKCGECYFFVFCRLVGERVDGSCKARPVIVPKDKNDWCGLFEYGNKSTAQSEDV